MTPAGGKSWRFRYRLDGREKLLVIGAYPDIGLAEARRRRRAARERIDEGGDPAVEKQQARMSARAATATTFEVVAREWHANQKGAWEAGYADLVLRRLEGNIFPTLGTRPIASIDSAQVLAALRKIEARGDLDAMRRVRQY